MVNTLSKQERKQKLLRANKVKTNLTEILLERQEEHLLGEYSWKRNGRDFTGNQKSKNDR